MELLHASSDNTESDKICRICMNGAEDLYSIFETGRIGQQYNKIKDILTESTSMEFFEDDELPSMVCTNCLLTTYKFHMFRKMAMKSNMLLRQNLWKKQKDDSANESSVVLNSQQLNNSNVKNQLRCTVNTNDMDEDDYEIVTVIVGDDQQGEETIDYKYSIENSIEDDSIVDVKPIISGEQDHIPKISLPKHRGRKAMPPKDKDSLTCKECGKTLSNAGSFRYHMQLHSDRTPFLCNECGEGFKTRNAYDGHMTTHLEANPNQCKICNKTYRQAASLKCHLLTHTGEKPFTCNICGKSMTQKSGFKKHMLTHSGEKPYSCEICGKAFRYSSNMIMHKKGHTGDKNFECAVCAKKFISKEQLKRHLYIHTGAKPHKCDICSKCFNRRSTLKVHMKVHSNTEPHTCKTCNKIFAKRALLNAHEKTHV